MNNEKAWYEKLDNWLSIVASILAIIGGINISVPNDGWIINNGKIDVSNNNVIEDISIDGNDNLIENKMYHNNNITKKIYNNSFTLEYNDSNKLDEKEQKEQDEQEIDVNRIIKKLRLGMNKNYVNELIGTPEYYFDEEELSNLFYVMEADKVIIRCIFTNEDLMVGYIVTAQNKDEQIEFPDPKYDNRVLKYGSSTFKYADYDKPDDKPDAGMGNDVAYNYYWQCYPLLEQEGFNGFIAAILPYGFYEEGAETLMGAVWAKKESLPALNNIGFDVDEEISKYKEILNPNTYGIIDMNYKDKINPCIENEKDISRWQIFVNGLLDNSSY